MTKRRNFLATLVAGVAGTATTLAQKSTTQTVPDIIIKEREHIISTDVLVVGGGVAGIGAAVGAAKAGA